MTEARKNVNGRRRITGDEEMGKTKYIDADKVIDYANQEITAAFYYPQDTQEQRKQDEQAYRDKWAFVKQVMVGMPAADVVERPKEADYTVENALKQKAERRGRWNIELDKNRLFYECKCSVCGHIESFDPKFRFFNYCPNCWASMEGEQE